LRESFDEAATFRPLRSENVVILGHQR